jgi:hypothetical protein
MNWMSDFVRVDELLVLYELDARFCVRWQVAFSQTPLGLGSSTVLCKLAQLHIPDLVWL